MKLKGLNAFFGNSKVLLIAFILFFASKILGVFNLQHNEDNILSIIMTIEFLAIFLLVFALFISYVLHESNIQKSLLSNIYLLQIIHFVVEIVTFKAKKGAVGELPAYLYYLVMFEIVLWVASYLTHLIMLSDKSGKKSNIKISQLLFLIMFVVEILKSGSLFMNTEKLLGFIYLNGFIPLFLIVCIDTKIGIYKRMRLELKEKGKWDDKAKAETKKIFNLF